jgi:hypothetical protein
MREIDQERSTGGGGLNAALHRLVLNVNDPAQFLLAQRFEDDDFVQAVDELRGELTSGGGDTGTRHPVSELRIANTLLREGIWNPIRGLSMRSFRSR